MAVKLCQGLNPNPTSLAKTPGMFPNLCKPWRLRSIRPIPIGQNSKRPSHGIEIIRRCIGARRKLRIQDTNCCWDAIGCGPLYRMGGLNNRDQVLSIMLGCESSNMFSGLWNQCPSTSRMTSSPVSVPLLHALQRQCQANCGKSVHESDAFVLGFQDCCRSRYFVMFVFLPQSAIDAVLTSSFP